MSAMRVWQRDPAGVWRQSVAGEPGRLAGEVLVQVVAARVPASGEQGGAVALAGTVLSADAALSELVGRPVAILPTARAEGVPPPVQQGVLQEQVAVPADRILPLAVGRPLAEAPMLATAAAVLSALSHRVAIGDSVLCLGAQPRMLLAAQWARVAGALDVYISDPDAAALESVRRNWLGERLLAAPTQAIERVRQLRQGCGVDLVILPTDRPDLRQAALTLLAPGGHLLVLDRLPEASQRFWRVSARIWGTGRLILRDMAPMLPADQLEGWSRDHGRHAESVIIDLQA